MPRWRVCFESPSGKMKKNMNETYVLVELKHDIYIKTFPQIYSFIITGMFLSQNHQTAELPR